ncbi:MAG: ABC transporter ATP-binding protein [Limisphaerales bacterium]
MRNRKTNRTPVISRRETIPRARRSLITIRWKSEKRIKRHCRPNSSGEFFHYTKPYAAKRNWLFVLTFTRGLQLPALAWLIGRTINGPISGRNLSEIYWYAAGYFALALFTTVNFHFRQRFALELGEAVVHDMRSDLFAKLMTMPMSFFNQTKFGRIISRMTSDIDSVRAGVQEVAFVLVVQGLQMTASAALMAWYDWKTFFADGSARADHLVPEQKLSAGDGATNAQSSGILEPRCFPRSRNR